MMMQTETFDKLVIEQLPTWEHNRDFDSREEEEDELRYAQMMMPMLNYEDGESELGDRYKRKPARSGERNDTMIEVVTFRSRLFSIIWPINVI